MQPIPGDENLATPDRAAVSVSTPHVTGHGARDPNVLLRGRVWTSDTCALADLDQSATFDTYDGQNQARGPEWYAIHFMAPTTFNCLELTMGFPYRDGGWWTSLGVEVQLAAGGAWQPVERLRITPPYNFRDSRYQRRPYEHYTLTFAATTARAVRLIGAPGGLAQFTSLARLAVYWRDLARWTPQPAPTPIPRIFRLIPPHLVCDLAENLEKVSGLVIGVPFMEFYLDDDHALQRWQRLRHNYEGQPDLWFLVGEALGWAAWNHLNALAEPPEPVLAPYVRASFHDTFASAIAPVVVEGEVLGTMKTHPVILRDRFDLAAQREYARQLGIPWARYRAALARSPKMTREQLEAAGALIGQIANTIVGLAHRLNHAQDLSASRARQQATIIQRAIAFMEANLESAIDVPDVAHAVWLSPSYFSALFSAHVGQTPGEYLAALRTERAKEYLAHTTMPILAISAALGYDPSYFARLFKARTGMTPRAYRRRLRAPERSAAEE
jgi:AraC-like DNA-binding protein